MTEDNVSGKWADRMSEGEPEEVLVSAVGICIKNIIQEAIRTKRTDGLDLHSEYIEGISPEFSVTIGQKLLNRFKRSSPPIIEAAVNLENIFGGDRVLTVMQKDKLPVITIKGTATELAYILEKNEEWGQRLQGTIGSVRNSGRIA